MLFKLMTVHLCFR